MLPIMRKKIDLLQTPRTGSIHSMHSLCKQLCLKKWGRRPSTPPPPPSPPQKKLALILDQSVFCFVVFVFSDHVFTFQLGRLPPISYWTAYALNAPPPLRGKGWRGCNTLRDAQKLFFFNSSFPFQAEHVFIWFHIPFTHNRAGVIWIHSVMQTLAVIYCRESSSRMYWVISLCLLFSFIAFWRCGAADLYQSLLDSLTLLCQAFPVFTAREPFPSSLFIIMMLAVIEENHGGGKMLCVNALLLV